MTTPPSKSSDTIVVPWGASMLDPDGSPNTAHSMNPVPLVITGDVGELREGGTLSDVAPTVLALLGEPQPDAMTGKPLQKT